MNVQAYYRRARSLGAFSAVDALLMAREAVALDEAAVARRIVLPGVVWNETLSDGSNALRLSHGVKVY